MSQPGIMSLILSGADEPQYNKTNKLTCAPSEDSHQPGHPSSLIRVFAVCMKKAWVLNYPLSAHRRLWSDWVDAQADLSLRWAHTHFIGFVMMRLIYITHVELSQSSRWVEVKVLQGKPPRHPQAECGFLIFSHCCWNPHCAKTAGLTWVEKGY